ncbi:hypothetical protein [Nocardiopsis rhodophaea]|uniref:hypothetical protein n=1 Tax=Nocardiopsis rhodophaea TaxID=280238 RepID=UPI0031D3F470
MSSPAPNRRPQRPVFNPDISARLRRRLEENSSGLLPRSRTTEQDQRGLQARWYGAAAGTLATSWIVAYVSGQAPEIAILALRSLSTLGLAALVLWGFRTGGRLGGVLTLLLAWGPLFLVWAASDHVALASADAFFWSAGPIGALALLLKGAPGLAAKHSDHYLLPEDFHVQEAALLARLQAAIDVVRKAQDVLADRLGTERTDEWISRQEWSIATALAECSDLQRDLDTRTRQAVSDRVLASLRPQQEALDTIRSSVAERVRRFEEYGDLAESAATTFLELQQSEENEKRNATYLNLLTSASAENTDVSELNGHNARALRQSFEEQVNHTITAGQWLSEMTEIYSSAAPPEPG